MVPFLTLQVAHVMTERPLTVEPQMHLSTLGKLFEAHNYNMFPVLQHNRLVGVVSQFDFLQAFLFTPKSITPHYDEILAQPLDTIMTTDPQTVRHDEPLSHALTRMIETKTKSFPVLRQSRLVGGHYAIRHLQRVT